MVKRSNKTNLNMCYLGKAVASICQQSAIAV